MKKEAIQHLIKRFKELGIESKIFKRTIRFFYLGVIDEGLDHIIELNAKAHGLKWYAQGYDFVVGVRSVCFDLPNS
ncbi:MAG: hypothetical protein IIB56_09755 [Planctomycetes bacterium]|nr:hypothetical protein [Planctomycetota bacterium]